MESRYATVRRLLNDEHFINEIGGFSGPQLAKRAGVEYRWLQKIKTGDSKRPDSELIDVLYGFLMNARRVA